MYENELESELFDFEDPLGEDLEGDPFLGGLLGTVGQALGGLLGEQEGDGLFEGEAELEFSLGEDLEAETAAALMEVLAGQVAEAESEDEADQFLPVLAALAPLALKALPALTKAAPLVAKAAKTVVPHLARGVVSIGKKLARSPTARKAVATLPTIARNTAADVLRNYARTGQVSGTTVQRALARNTAQVLRSPSRRHRCLRRSRRVATMARNRLRAVGAM